MPKDFYGLTWNQYCLKCKGYYDRENKEWERIRWMTWNIVSPHVKKMPSLERFLPLPGDRAGASEERIDKAKNALLKAWEKKNGK